ncbi:MAG: prephenate dehydrogenase [Candidatus Omnitrophica bacterium]|nr:prephenate dehydrogenase [Candidatus Omnitrophota bacterium]MDD5487571.1 prephenate dehydrogenase [Candidatus Omnitrophota bacterium]
MEYNKITIIGMGLIGGSIGKALMKKRLAREVVGVFRRESSLKRAVKAKALTTGYVNNYGEAVKDADIIVICTPVGTIKKNLDELGKVIRRDGNVIVTDVGSTKEEIVKYAAKYKDRFTFIGSHPLAGSEKAGVESATADLFEKSVCLVSAPPSRSREKKVKRLTRFWEALGAKVWSIEPARHDRNLAFSSHLPHIAAYALVGTLEKKFPACLLATGFRDTTRVASSAAEVWGDIFMSNKKNVLAAIKRYKKEISSIEKIMVKGDRSALKKKIGKMKETRDAFFK